MFIKQRNNSYLFLDKGINENIKFFFMDQCGGMTWLNWKDVFDGRY